jgi:enediyne biosynthesis protein E4
LVGTWAGAWFNPFVGRFACGAAVAAVAALAVVGSAGCRGSSTAADVPRFVADSGGIDHRYEGDFQYFVGGGVASFDCDDDGRSELFFAGGSAPAALYHNESPTGGALRFTRLASPVTDLTAVTGAYPLDIDGDGRTDVAVLRVGEDVILRGLGGCRFERANETFGINDAGTWTVAFSATWEGSNELPTLAFGGYLAPDRATCEDSRLLRPAPAGDRYAAAVPLAPGYCTLSMLFSDWSRSGRRDLRLSNDRQYYRDGSDQLWRIAPDEAPRLYTEADGWRPLQLWGMGIASEDVTGDGYPDVFLTSQGDNKLQTLADGPARPAYEDIALDRGATAHRPFVGGDVLPSTAWHDEFADVNNDGFADLFIAKGNVEAEPGYATRDPSNLLIGQADGTFVEGAETAGILSYERARGAALVDLNLDGLLDLVVVNRAEPVGVWRNVGRGDADRPQPMGSWVAVRLRQPAGNVDAIGAWVETRAGDRTRVHEVTVGGGHASGQLGWIHIGVGQADRVEVRVHWPDGETGPWLTLNAGSFATVDRGASQATPWSPEAS